MAYQFDFPAVFDYTPVLLKGIRVTIELIVIGGGLGIALGIFGAWARTQGPRWLKPIVGVYVELIRNTPFLVQLFFIFFGLPGVGLRINEMEAAILTMVINLGAYSTEIIRAGIGAVARGQTEAALSLAMTRFQVFRYIILRPALQKIWPALSSQLVIVMLGSAVCSQIAVEELSFAANFIQGRNFRAFESYAVASVIYLVLAILLRQLLRLIGQRYVLARPTPPARATPPADSRRQRKSA
ncbi:MAG: amino acid ABC transporter permease [Janthinobacterium lividum]